MIKIKNELTEREINYLKTIFKLNGHKKPVGPAKIAKKMNTSRPGALKKLKKLEEKELGTYIKNKGLKINEKGLEKIKEEIEKHHLLEKFLQKNLNLSHEQSCQESAKIANSTSKDLLKVLKSQINLEKPCKCGYEKKENLDIQDLQNCHWLKKGGDAH